MNHAALQAADGAHFRNRLRERWLALREEIRNTLLRADAERYADIAGDVHDLEDESLADLLTDVSHAEVARDVAEVRDIETALRRIAAGTYGVCVRCGKSIDLDRLEAHPTAKRCLPCQQYHERSRPRTRGSTL